MRHLRCLTSLPPGDQTLHPRDDLGLDSLEGDLHVKLQRHGKIAGLSLAALLALAACGSDNTEGTSAGSGSSGGTNADCADGEISASGSSAQKTAMNAWIKAYAEKCGSSVNYDPSGSGAGIKDFIAAKTAFAGSDSALKEDEQPQADQRCKDGKAVNLPMVVSPISVIYNLQGVDKLTLTPTLIANIFQGKITKWNDPAIAAANSGVTLPATTITVVFRSKDSGTTENLTKFLDKAAGGAWTLGTGKAWKGKTGKGAPDSAGIASEVKGTDGAFSYVDTPDAKKNDLKSAALDTGSGPVEISDETVGKAVASAKRAGEGNDIKLSLDYGLKAAGAYPLVLVTYEITCEKGLPAEQSKLAKSFLKYTASADGQAAAAKAGYSKLPTELQADVTKAVDAIS